MSIIHRVVTVLVAISALTVMAPGQAETLEQVGQKSVMQSVGEQTQDKLQSFVNAITTPVVDTKELTCLARNIFFEAGNEPEEGKVAVGLVTLNRLQDGRFGKSVCGVVDQRLTAMIPKTQIIEKKQLWQTTTEKQTVWSKLTICQFSWRCMFVKNPKSQDERWLESQAIAHELLASQDTYTDWRYKYAGALYFHSTGVRPVWAKQKHHVGRIGGHHFYEERVATASF